MSFGSSGVSGAADQRSGARATHPNTRSVADRIGWIQNSECDVVGGRSERSTARTPGSEFRGTAHVSNPTRYTRFRHRRPRGSERTARGNSAPKMPRTYHFHGYEPVNIQSPCGNGGFGTVPPY